MERVADLRIADASKTNMEVALHESEKHEGLRSLKR